MYNKTDTVQAKVGIDGLLVVFHQVFITGNQAKLKNEQGLTGSPGHV